MNSESAFVLNIAARLIVHWAISEISELQAPD
jgi:hypothetical protein